MDRFGEIFQAMIHDHGQRPRNFGELAKATYWAEGVNPITGDQLQVSIIMATLDGADSIAEMTFSGRASALATTSASVMTSHLTGMSLHDAEKAVTQTLRWIAGEDAVPDDLPEDEYAVLLEIRNFPHRVKCASLAWHTALCALQNNEE